MKLTFDLGTGKPILSNDETVGSQLFDLGTLSDSYFVSAPIATPIDGAPFIIRIADNGTAQALTWDGAYVGSKDMAIPTSTVPGNTLTVSGVYNATLGKNQVLSVSPEPLSAYVRYSKDAGTTWADTVWCKNGDTLRICATFNDDVLDSPVPKLAVSGSILSATAMTKISTKQYSYDLAVSTEEIANATCALSLAKDFAGNVIVPTPTS